MNGTWSTYIPIVSGKTASGEAAQGVFSTSCRGFSGAVFPNPANRENKAMLIKERSTLMSLCIVAGPNDYPLCGPAERHTCFPFYVYDPDGSNRRENMTDWAMDQFRLHYNAPAISKWSIFDYVYGLLHHPGYRKTFSNELRHELPRIPFAPDFRAFQQAGQKLIELHLNYPKLEPWKLEQHVTPGELLSYRVEKMTLSKDKTSLKVNPSLTLRNLPKEAAQYRLGRRSALEWVVDQYQISTDVKSGVRNNPNRDDDERYLLRLVGQVVRVSVETTKIVQALPENFS